jgi:hypothetical protein
MFLLHLTGPLTATTDLADQKNRSDQGSQLQMAGVMSLASGFVDMRVLHVSVSVRGLTVDGAAARPAEHAQMAVLTLLVVSAYYRKRQLFLEERKPRPFSRCAVKTVVPPVIPMRIS